jgi:hypothetical protein
VRGTFGVSLASAYLTIVIGMAVVLLAVRHPAPKPARSATGSERAEAAALVATKESEWNDDVARSFPGDRWSQRDDFHGRELGRVIEIARAKGIRVDDVLRAVDDDLHRMPVRSFDAPDPRNARAVPCKPRPVYD